MITLPEMPARVARLPRDSRGYPVPWFVHWNEDGTPDFRVIGVGKWAAAVNFQQCWICGDRLGRNVTFVIGPMSAVNRTNGEPPSHFECALFAAKACPYLTHPRMKRNEHDEIPEGVTVSPTAITRNPGVAALWTTRSFMVIRGLAGELLAAMGPPTEPVQWFCEGREATRAEVLGSIDSGLPLLMQMNEMEPEQLRAEGALMIKRSYEQALELLPP